MEEQRGQWGSRLGFILAATGSAIGLGNIWKFPYITGENGGGLFVLIYLVCIGLVGIPIMMAEIMIGRAAEKQPVEAFHTLQGRRTAWAGVGWLGVLAGFVILSYYAVVAGWAMDYTLKSVANFTTPINEMAEQEAVTYRATASLDDMRAGLIERHTERDAKPMIDDIRRTIRPSALEDYERYEKALTEAGGTDEAKARLLEVEKVRAAVEVVEPRMVEIAAVEEEVRAEITARYALVPDAEIRDEAQEGKLREVMAQEVDAAFNAVSTDGWMTSFWTLLFMLITITIVARGISRGIERTCRVLMPLLFVLILVMVFYGATREGFKEAVDFIFKPDVHKLRPSGVLEALGHAFFTLSLGMGAMITYGSYQKSKRALAGESVTIAGLDTTIALLACLMIFPIIMTYDQEPAAGPGLVFQSMPLAFAELGRTGMLLGIIFFGLVVFAALTSAISLLEVVASYFIDSRGWARGRAAWLVGGAIWLFGLPAAFAVDPGFTMPGWAKSYPASFFDTMDYMATNWMLPLGGLLIAIYAGWVMPARLRNAELAGLSPALTTGWLLLVRIVAPVLVIVVLLQKVGILDADELLHGLFN
ncbi:MAG: sodium-dependent transporter [Planctomycetota bacterium]|jgi:NSS family neurotransmitter:Na+ symporter